LHLRSRPTDDLNDPMMATSTRLRDTPNLADSTATFPARSNLPNRSRGWNASSELPQELGGMAASLAEVDPRSAERLRDLAESMTTEHGRHRWADVDLRRAFNTDRLSHVYAVRREGGYAPQSIEFADKVRNVLVLMPILLTWAALAEASRAYRAFIDANPDQTDQPFLLLWQRGFGGESSPFSPSFSTVAIVDAVIILIIILLTFYSHGRRERQEDLIADTSAAFQTDLDNVLAEASVALAGDRASRPMLLTESVERLADRFERSSQELLTQLQVEHGRLESLASRREKEFHDFGVFASGMRAGADEMHRLLVDLRQVSSSLETSLEDLSSEVGTAGEQQRSLLTAVSNLERLTSSAIQSDQSVTRQLASAVNNLAEAADKAVGGADSAAQAGRSAAEAARGISAIAGSIAESQSRIEHALVGASETNARLADALRANGSSNGSTGALQREVHQDLTRLVDRIEELTEAMSRASRQTPAADSLQQAGSVAPRNEFGRSRDDNDDVERSGGFWPRSPRS
jgi:hypothetical protein